MIGRDGLKTKQTIRDQQGNVIARVSYWNWSEISVDEADELLTQQLQQAGYTWDDVEQE